MRIKFLILFLALGSFLADAFENDDCLYDDSDWHWRIEAGGAGGRFIGFDKNYAELGLFTALPFQGDWVYFSDLKGYWIQDGKFAANAGVGMRYLDQCSGYLYGGNCYYDYIKTSTGAFNRLGIGIEALSPCFDIRVNGYLPLNESREKWVRVDNYGDGFQSTIRKKDFAFYGVDAEVGMPFCQEDCFSLYAAIGPYYYGTKNIEKIIGGQARLQFKVIECLTIEGRFSYDDTYYTRAQGVATLSFALDELFDCCKNSPCIKYVTQPVQRNPLPFFHRCCSWDWNW